MSLFPPCACRSHLVWDQEARMERGDHWDYLCTLSCSILDMQSCVYSHPASSLFLNIQYIINIIAAVWVFLNVALLITSFVLYFFSFDYRCNECWFLCLLVFSLCHCCLFFYQLICLLVLLCLLACPVCDSLMDCAVILQKSWACPLICVCGSTLTLLIL